MMRKIWVFVCTVITALLAMTGAFLAGKRRGKENAEAKQTKESLENGLTIKKDINELHNSSVDAIDDFLRQDARD